ncbi:helix-turn-helix transcriptional regulator [Planctellipticum variicoloris]|uniref:helix-turn-helix transcriptional regulator n=1 Tax=Planctellipticum variicoloris TaxID=3064265 RepID=UPI003013F73C|nr:WYL domain-containing protein [Planctomycetaceae bacterium SH412]
MSDSAQLIRQWTLLRSLSARRHGATLKELAADAGVSQKTILRDLKLLRLLAFPIDETVGEFGRKHWRMTDAGGLPSLNFTLEEAAALYLGRQYLEGLAGTLFWSGAQSAFSKIKSALGDAALRHITKLATRFYLQSHRLTDYTGRAELIDRLMMAIEDRKLTVLTYQSLRSTEPVTYFDIHPYAMVHYRAALYLIAWSRDHGEIRTFKVDRVSDVEVQGLQFERPGDFEPAKFLQHAFGIFAGDGPPRTVRIRFAAPVVRLLEEKTFHPSQTLNRQRDGSVIATYELGTFEEFTSWVLSFGPQAEVLEPAELREQVGRMLVEASGLYEPERPERVKRGRGKG